MRRGGYSDKEITKAREGLISTIKDRARQERGDGKKYDDICRRAEALIGFYKITRPAPMSFETCWEGAVGDGKNACLTEAIFSGVIPPERKPKNKSNDEQVLSSGWNSMRKDLIKKHKELFTG